MSRAVFLGLVPQLKRLLTGRELGVAEDILGLAAGLFEDGLGLSRVPELLSAFPRAQKKVQNPHAQQDP